MRRIPWSAGVNRREELERLEATPFWEKQWTPQHLPALGNTLWGTVWDELTAGFCPEDVPAGTVLYQQGDPAVEMLYLQCGQVRVECVHSSGKKRTVYLLFDGITVGEAECLYGGVREFCSVAATECRIFRIPMEEFKQRVERSPALALKLFQVAARKSQVLSRMLIRDSFLSARGRVIQFLLTISQRYSVKEADGARLTIRLTHQEVADFLGISRVAVSQCFQSLCREGLLEKSRRYYRFPDLRALEAQLDRE